MEGAGVPKKEKGERLLPKVRMLIGSEFGVRIHPNEVAKCERIKNGKGAIKLQ